MKKSNLKIFIILFAVVQLLFMSSCEEMVDPMPKDDFLPVLDKNFSYEVDGNDVNFTTSINGNVWVTTNGVQYAYVDKKVTVNLPNKGTYTFTCGSLGSGETLTSEPFDVVIENDDLDFLNVGLWLYLSGGANKTKTWKMDMSQDNGSVYFDGPVYYSGDDNGPYWAWDVTDEVSADNPYTATLDDGSMKEFTSLFNWSPKYSENTWLMAAMDYGTITFDATNGQVSTTKFGKNAEGTFTFDAETMKLSFGGDIVLPIDTARLNEGQFTAEDLANLRIFSLQDSSMQIGIKRTYEGFEDDGVTQKPAKWTMVYNFIVDDYDYPLPEVFTFEEPVDTDYALADLVGTWKYESVPFDWVGWKSVGDQGTVKNPAALNNWATAADLLATDWVGMTQENLDLAATVELVFNGDGTAVINGLATNFTLENGVITFTDDISLTMGDHWFSVAGPSIKILKDVEAAITGGIWIGIQNETKPESSSYHIVKQ